MVLDELHLPGFLLYVALAMLWHHLYLPSSARGPDPGVLLPGLPLLLDELLAGTPWLVSPASLAACLPGSNQYRKEDGWRFVAETENRQRLQALALLCDRCFGGENPRVFFWLPGWDRAWHTRGRHQGTHHRRPASPSASAHGLVLSRASREDCASFPAVITEQVLPMHRQGSPTCGPPDTTM